MMGKLRIKIITFFLLVTITNLVATSFFMIQGFIEKKEQDLIEQVTLRNLNLSSFINFNEKESDISLKKLPAHIWNSGGIKAGLYGAKNIHLFDECESLDDHHLYCDACGLSVNIESIEEEEDVLTFGLRD